MAEKKSTKRDIEPTTLVPEEPVAVADEPVIDISPGLNIQSVTLKITGLTRLVTRRMSDDDLREIEQRRVNGRSSRAARNPDQEFEDSMYKMDDGKPGIPVSAFEMAALSAIAFEPEIKQDLRGVLFVSAPGDPSSELVQIKSLKPRMRSDKVRVGRGIPDIRYRAEFNKWSCVIQVDYDASIISEESVVALFNRAGFSIGIGEGRPEKTGRQGWGRFKAEAK